MFRGCLRAATTFLLAITFLIRSLGSITSAPFRIESRTLGLALLFVNTKGKVIPESSTVSEFCSSSLRFNKRARFIPESMTPLWIEFFSQKTFQFQKSRIPCLRVRDDGTNSTSQRVWNVCKSFMWMETIKWDIIMAVSFLVEYISRQ